MGIYIVRSVSKLSVSSQGMIIKDTFKYVGNLQRVKETQVMSTFRVINEDCLAWRIAPHQNILSLFRGPLKCFSCVCVGRGVSKRRR